MFAPVDGDVGALRADSAGARVRQRDDIGKRICTSHMTSSRKHVSASKPVARPRPWLPCRVERNVIEVARLLHDAWIFRGTRFECAACGSAARSVCASRRWCTAIWR